MTNEIAEGIAERIVTAFPSEAKGTYFIKGKKRSTLKIKSHKQQKVNFGLVGVIEDIKHHYCKKHQHHQHIKYKKLLMM